MIDHINRVRTDNRLCNLRECDQSTNSLNQERRITNTTGYPGVHRFGDRYRAFITKNYKTRYLGTYSDIEEAGHAYLNAKEELQNVG